MYHMLGIDVGGTFTDFVAFSPETRDLMVWKTLSTPRDPSDGIVGGLAKAKGIEDIDHLRFGTTVATNAILERTGANVAYVTTQGFKDVPFIQRGKRQSHYDITWIKSNGGEMTLGAAREAPIQLSLSGPTGGVVGAKQVARLIGIDQLVTLDMGGTSTDVSTVVDGRESFTTSFEIEFGVPIQIPMIDIRTMGAGGGSIAWIDKGGLLRVGPQSAGADPGPACYGQGGSDACATDANVVLGRINPENFLGGEMVLDAPRARAAVGEIAAKINKSIEDAALGIVQIANNNMVGALRMVLTERGLDPRDFTLLAFGGAGPVHVSDLMELANIPSGIVPNFPGQFSAFGFIMTDARVDLERSARMTSKAFNREHANTVMAALTREGIAALEAQGYNENIEMYRTLEMRYLGQNHELEVPISFVEFDPETLAAVWDQFHAAHKARFNFNIPGETIELVSIKLTVVSVGEKPELPILEPATAEATATANRSVIFDDGPHDTPVYQRDTLRAGHSFTGPLLIEEPASVTVVRPGHRVRIDQYGNILIGDIAER